MPETLVCWLTGLQAVGDVEDLEFHHEAKRRRLMLPDYGRSASDPPLSFHRRNAHAMSVPLDALKGPMRPAAAQLPRALRSVQSGPARSTSALGAFVQSFALGAFIQSFSVLALFTWLHVSMWSCGICVQAQSCVQNAHMYGKVTQQCYDSAVRTLTWQ